MISVSFSSFPSKKLEENLGEVMTGKKKLFSICGCGCTTDNYISAFKSYTRYKDPSGC